MLAEVEYQSLPKVSYTGDLYMLSTGASKIQNEKEPLASPQLRAFVLNMVGNLRLSP